MTLISSIIADAFRESNLIPIGKAPNENQSTEALRLYNAVLNATYGGDAGERLTDWPLGNFGRFENEEPIEDRRLHHPPVNSRLIALNEDPATVWLPVVPQDGARIGVADPFARLDTAPLTLDGNGRPIEDATLIVLDEPGMFREWLYRADLARWVRITDLVLTDQNPFPASFDAMFIILLAMRLNPRYGRALDQQSIAILKQNKQEFIARYLQSRPLEAPDDISWPFLSAQSYDVDRGFSSQRAFNRGSYGA